MVMDKFELQRLRDLPIEGVAERLGLQVSRHKCLCPFHADNHPSLSFKVSRNTYRCFVCGESGSTIDLVMKCLNKPFLDACRWLADENNIILTEYKPEEEKPAKPFDALRYEQFFVRPWLSEAARRFLFDERKLDERVVRWCRLTSWRDKRGTDWLQIPYYDREGQLVGIQNRNLAFGSGLKVQGAGLNPHLPTPSSQLNPAPRFRFPSGSRCGIYNLPVLNLLQPHDPLYITEGASDCWAMLSAGHKAIAIPSATLLSQRGVELLSTVTSQLSTEFHMYPDHDEPGERLFLQLKEVLPNLEHHQLPLGCKDFGEYYVRMKSEE